MKGGLVYFWLFSFWDLFMKRFIFDFVMGGVGLCLLLVSGCTSPVEEDSSNLNRSSTPSTPSSISSSLTHSLTHSSLPSSSSTPKLSSQSYEIQGGMVDDSQKNVVGLVIQQGYAGGGCTGSLIAPNLVLTAQHCIAPTSSNGIACGVSSFGDPYAPRNIFVTTDTAFPQYGYYRVREIVVPENPTSDVCGNDVALLILNQRVSSGEATPLVPRLDEPVIPGEIFKASGYGHTGNGDGAGVRRSIYRREVLCLGYLNGCGEQNQAIYPNEWVGTDGTCEGDSGGPALDDQNQVVGVLSRGGQGCSLPVYTDVVEQAAWIRETAERAAVLGNYQPPSWVTGMAGMPPPDSDGDGIADRYDNCADVPNPSQDDFDQDRIGDLCDSLVSTDRGGICEVCDSCTQDSDCGADGGICLLLQTGGICTYECRGDFDCPSTSSCFPVSLEESYCINEDVEARGLCPDEYVCGGPRGLTPPEDDGQCHVCEPCSNALECASGVCADLGGQSVCSRACETDEDCRDGSICSDQSGRKLCINANANDAGICPADFQCTAPVMDPVDEEDPTNSSMNPSDPMPEENESNTETSDQDENTDSNSKEDDVVAQDEGCQSSSSWPLSPFSSPLLWLAFSWILLRVRKTQSSGRETGIIDLA